jgi:hypothetical protein
MIGPFKISLDIKDRGWVSEAEPHPPHKFDEFNGAPYRRRATLRYRLRSGKAFSMDHFLYGLF